MISDQNDALGDRSDNNRKLITLEQGKKMKKVFDGKTIAKLGTEKNPAVVNVQTEERKKELESVFKENGWRYTIEIEEDKPENIKDLEILLNPIKTMIAEKKVGRNEPCPCGSGKKYKKCCGYSDILAEG